MRFIGLLILGLCGLGLWVWFGPEDLTSDGKRVLGISKADYIVEYHNAQVDYWNEVTRMLQNVEEVYDLGGKAAAETRINQAIEYIKTGQPQPDEKIAEELRKKGVQNAAKNMADANLVYAYAWQKWLEQWTRDFSNVAKAGTERNAAWDAYYAKIIELNMIHHFI